jgi:hypothetical protein
MSQPRFIFDTVDYQNGANTFNNYVESVNAVNNAPATGNSFKFQTDADRMKYILGTKGKPRLSGYYSGLYCTLYPLTVVQDAATIPSINGPGGTGWGRVSWSGPITDIINITDEFIQKRINISDYVGIQIAGYIYSPVASTITFQVLTDDGAAVYFNNQLVISNAWKYQGPTSYTSAAVTLNPGYNPIRILFFEGAVSCVFQFSYQIGSGPFQRNLSCDCFFNYNQM